MKLKTLVVLALLGCAVSGLADLSSPAFAKQLKLSDLAPGLYGYKDPNTGRYRKYFVPDPKSPEQQISDLEEQPLPVEFLDLVVGKKTEEEDPDRAEIEALLGKKKQNKSDPSEPKAEKSSGRHSIAAPEEKMEMSDQPPLEMTDRAPAEMPAETGEEPQAVPSRKPPKAAKKSAAEGDGAGFGSIQEPSMDSMQEPFMDSMKEPSVGSVMKPSKPSSPATDDSGEVDGFFPGEKTMTGGDPFSGGGDQADQVKAKHVNEKHQKSKAEKPPKPEKPPKAGKPPNDEVRASESEAARPEKVKPEKIAKEKPPKVEKPLKEKPANEVADDTGSGDGLSDKVFQAPFNAGGKAGRFFGRGLKKTGKPFSKINGFFFGPK